MATITSANASFYLTVAGIAAVGSQKLQGWATDDAFAAEDVTVSETLMGIDGKMSAGFVNAICPMTITFQADSPSLPLFDAWWAQQRAVQDTYFANGIITLPSVGYTYALVKGALKSLPPMPDAKKVLQPRKIKIDWQSIVAAPI